MDANRDHGLFAHETQPYGCLYSQRTLAGAGQGQGLNYWQRHVHRPLVSSGPSLYVVVVEAVQLDPVPASESFVFIILSVASTSFFGFRTGYSWPASTLSSNQSS